MSESATNLGITALWTTLVAALGLVLIVRDVDTLRASARAEPETLPCEAWVHSKGLRWVRVEGCAPTGLDAGALQQVACDAGTAWVDGPLSAALVGTSRVRSSGGATERVLTVGEDPRRWGVLGTALLGLLVMSWGMLPWVRRWQAAAAEKRAQDEVYRRHS
jgi:hypothetical protein